MRRVRLGALLGAVVLAGCGSEHHVSTPKRATIIGVNANGTGPVLSRTVVANGGPFSIEISPPSLKHASRSRRRLFAAGATVAAESGCLACHRIGTAGNRGPGPDLTRVGDRLPPLAIERTLIRPTPPMPSFRNLPPARKRALVAFLSLLR
jgi:ubiquinol-cytochrome c reductase cytochrome b subunit/menaquinol-cytochrome c reductase cytochrome b/c subunit